MIKKRTVIIGAVIFTLIIISLVVYSQIPRSYIKFATAPQQVTVSVDKNKQSVNNGDTISVTPGNHDITVSRDGFESYTKEVNLTNGQAIEFLVALNPLTDTAKQLLTDDKSQAVIQRFYGDIIIKQTNDTIKNNPILNILPIQARLYNILACPSQKYPHDTTKIALCINETNSSLEPYVLQDIQSRGYNPSDYEIIWNIISS